MLLIINIVVFTIQSLLYLWLSLPNLPPFLLCVALLQTRPSIHSTVYCRRSLSHQSSLWNTTIIILPIQIYIRYDSPIHSHQHHGWLTDGRPQSSGQQPPPPRVCSLPTSALEVHREGKAEWNKIKHWKKTIYVQTHITTTRGSGQSRRRRISSSRKEQLGSRPENPLLEEFLRFSPITCLPCASCTWYRASTVSCSAPS